MSRARILDPHAVPVVGTDAHLPAVDAARLTPQALRERLANPPPWEPEFAGDGRRFADREPAHASVLVPLVDRGDHVNVLLTQRTAHLRDHAGQISFPGGRAETDDESVIATALRETQEEVGLAPSYVEVIGQLPTYTTITAFVVTPVVGIISPPFTLTLDSFEVAEAFEVPLSFLMSPAHHQRHRVESDELRREFYSMPWEAAGEDGLPRTYFIWGATAAMLRNLYRLLAA